MVLNDFGSRNLNLTRVNKICNWKKYYSWHGCLLNLYVNFSRTHSNAELLKQMLEWYRKTKKRSTYTEHGNSLPHHYQLCNPIQSIDGDAVGRKM